MYDYREAMRADVREAIDERYTHEELREMGKDEAFEKLNDDLWVDDSVTGNASGSYTFNSYEAEENICHNMDLLGEALTEFGCGADYLMNNGAEACDVTIRCYLLGGILSEVLDEVFDEIEEEEEETEEE